MDAPYTKRELDHFFTEITEQLDRIEEQTTRTNGRVNALEAWRNWLTGGLAVVVPLFTLALNNLFQFIQKQL